MNQKQKEQQLLMDFKDWSGGFEPHEVSNDEIQTYVDGWGHTNLPGGLTKKQAGDILKKAALKSSNGCNNCPHCGQSVNAKMKPTAPHSLDVRRKYGKIDAPDWDMADESESDDDLPVGAKRRRKDGVWQKKSKGPKGWFRISSTDKIIRDTSKLTKQLIGLDGQRVEVVDMDGQTHRFWVGKSTGWQPVHLVLKTARSKDGEPADQEYKSVRVIVKK